MTTEIRLPGLSGGLFVVTGEARGQGAQEALLLAENGAHVIAGEPEEVANVVFLLSDAASYVTGAEVTVDGGQLHFGSAPFLSEAVRPAQQPAQP